MILANLTVFLLSDSVDIFKKTQLYFPKLYSVPSVHVRMGCSTNTLSQEGCFQAHLNAWDKIRTMNLPDQKFLILESDWYFATTPYRAFSTIAKGINLPEEYVAIGYCGVDMACMQAYLINRNLVERLSCLNRCMIQNTGPRHCQIDWFMSSLFATHFFTAKIMHFPNKKGLFGSGVIQQNRYGRKLENKNNPFYHYQCSDAIRNFTSCFHALSNA